MADQQVKCSQPLAIGEAQSNLQRNTVVHSLDGENDKDWSDKALRRCGN